MLQKIACQVGQSAAGKNIGRNFLQRFLIFELFFWPEKD
jgi:hypothetical protein